MILAGTSKSWEAFDSLPDLDFDLLKLHFQAYSAQQTLEKICKSTF